MAVARYLADTSAMARLRHPVVRDALGPLIEQGLVGTCAVLDLEALFSARTTEEHARMKGYRAALPRFACPDEVWDRAAEVQELLVRRGQHRCASIPDLLVCAVAERHGVTVLHYDADFDTISAVTSQPTQWIVPRGTANPD